MNAATTPKSHSQIPSRKNPTTLLHSSPKCSKSQPHCLAYQNQSKANMGPAETISSQYI